MKARTSLSVALVRVKSKQITLFISGLPLGSNVYVEQRYRTRGDAALDLSPVCSVAPLLREDVERVMLVTLEYAMSKGLAQNWRLAATATVGLLLRKIT